MLWLVRHLAGDMTMSIKRVLMVTVALLGLLGVMPVVTTAVAQDCNPCSAPK